MENEIQFDQVQRPIGATTCSSCRGALLGSYYQANGQVLCAKCAERIGNFFQGKEGAPARVLKAFAFGLGGGLAGAVVYTAVLVLAHFNLALITILIGWMVGKAVRQGSGLRGGLGYQIMAALITYAAIGLSLMASDMFSATGGAERNVFQYIFLLVFGAIAGPVIAAMHSPIGGLITVFGLLQAWKLNTPTQVTITGPHSLAPVDRGPIDPLAAPAPPALPSTEPLPPLSA